MKIFRRSGGSEFGVDCDLDDEPMRRARKALRRGNAQFADELYKTCKNANERAYILEGLADWTGDAEHLHEWKQRSSSPAAAKAVALQRLKWAWEARGASAGDLVGDGQAASFLSRLPVARDAILECLHADRRDASLVPWLMACARGLEDLNLASRAMAECLKRSPDLRAAYSSMLLVLTPKWLGSHDAMFDFARETCAQAPAESGASVVLVEAHYYTAEELDPFGPDVANYWRKPEVVSDVLVANERCSLSGFVGMPGIRLRQWLAYALWRSGQFQQARVHFEQIGSVSNYYPWRCMRLSWLFGRFGKARRECMRS